MKKIFLTVIALTAVTFSFSQTVTDGLRYSTDRTNGTARFQAMSGAFGALGGDLSAVGINPAGSAIFIKNSATLSLSIDDSENDATYFNNTVTGVDTDFSINQAGAVFVFTNIQEGSRWKKFTLGVNYDNTNNYDDEIFVRGIGNTSIAQFFLAQAQGIPLNLLQLQSGESIDDLYAFLGQTEGVTAQNAFLGFQGFIFDPLDNDPNNNQYISNIANGSFNQEYLVNTEGFNGKFTFNAAAQYGNNFYFGINLNSHTIDYNRSSFLYETNSNTESTTNEVVFQNNLSVLGAGFSAQIGTIVKMGDGFRVGLTYDTPTWYNISEETTQFLETTRTESGQTQIATVDPRVINVFEEYDLQTPGKITASAAYIFGKKGLISFDYSYKDYSNIKFRPANNAFFAAQNNTIKSTLKGASTYKLGGEYRISNISLRGGYHFEESSYANESTLGNINGFSLGFGYNFGNYNFDLAYARSEQDSSRQLYRVGLTDATTISSTYSSLVFTLGFSL